MITTLAETLAVNVARRDPHVEDGCSPERTPIFFGCYDWHSAVHSHWALMRLRSRVTDVTHILDARITPERAARELAFLAARPAFEIPYGLAWLLALCREARETRWHAALAGLEQLARDRMVAWARGLEAPVWSGQHAQSAFGLALALDWARDHDAEAEQAFVAAALLHAVPCPLPEPGPHDFLSPSLAAAWLVGRVREPDVSSLPDLRPVRAIDRADGKLVHWDGLNLSRAWMLAALGLRERAAEHLAAGLAALDDMTYAGSHWLPSFAIYALTEA